MGVTKGTIGGLLAADMACNEDNELIAYMQSLGTPNTVPPGRFSILASEPNLPGISGKPVPRRRRFLSNLKMQLISPNLAEIIPLEKILV